MRTTRTTLINNTPLATPSLQSPSRHPAATSPRDTVARQVPTITPTNRMSHPAVTASAIPAMTKTVEAGVPALIVGDVAPVRYQTPTHPVDIPAHPVESEMSAPSETFAPSEIFVTSEISVTSGILAPKGIFALKGNPAS